MNRPWLDIHAHARVPAPEAGRVIVYRDFELVLEPAAVAAGSKWRWSYAHKDWCGSQDPEEIDDRCGMAESEAAAMAEIDERFYSGAAS